MGMTYNKKIFCSIASIPSRVNGLQRVVERALRRCDEINVYLNHYQDIPGFLNHKKVQVATSQEFGELTDRGKFYFPAPKDSYHFTMDDDLIYPDGYFQRMIDKIEAHGRRAIIGVHGRIIRKRFRGYYDSRSCLFLSYFNALEKDTRVHILGTGTVAYHTDTVNPSLSDFKKNLMADIWLAILALRRNIPMIAIAREKDWLKPGPESSDDSALSLRYYHQPEEAVEQNRLILDNWPWPRVLSPVDRFRLFCSKQR